MLTFKSLLELAGLVLMLAAAAILLHDLYRLYEQSSLILSDQARSAEVRPHWRAAARTTALALASIVAGAGIQTPPNDAPLPAAAYWRAAASGARRLITRLRA